ncbi:SDR family oxidoreductase [Christiangramia aquimixticola]|uniref:SDR family oxidoreductase n=1 Tax=Christiangramia aquimixticola TaxID=1697558 RepID=UPI003AA91109
MKVLIIGATGKTGKKLVQQALAKGHEVSVLVRNSKKIKIDHPKLKIYQGNILKPESFRHAFQDQDAVLSALGHKRFIFKTRILSEGTKNIIKAMKANNIQRFICITSLGLNNSRYKLGLYYTLFTIPVILWFYFKDKELKENIIKESGLEWTIVRPGQLTNGKLRTNYYHGPKAGNFILTKFISRASVAHFMLKILEDKTYIRETPGITSYR